MKIYVCGDSTAASYTPDKAPLTGWGQLLPGFTGGVPVENRAMAGRSSKSFLAEGRLQSIEGEIGPGDLMLIQFAHNDESDLVWRHTDPWTGYTACLEIFVDTARLRGARPVLLTPICVRSWRDGCLTPSHAGYADAVRVLAARRVVPLIDLYEKSFRLVRGLGDAQSRELYMHLEKGVYPAWPDGQRDDTHTQTAGAGTYARLVAEGLREYGLI